MVFALKEYIIQKGEVLLSLLLTLTSNIQSHGISASTEKYYMPQIKSTLR
jgi:hypothetical protein